MDGCSYKEMMIKYFFDLIVYLVDLPNKIKVINFFKKKFSKDKINLIDIGAHKGETIFLFLKNFQINKIIAFEPNKILFQNLKEKINDPRISIYNYGVGLYRSEKDLQITIDSASSTINKINTDSKYFERKKKYFLLKKNQSFIQRSEKIEIINLSDFTLSKEEKIDILKIDTEGYEYNVIKGIDSIDFKKIKFIYFEHHYDLMIEKGYKFRDINAILKKNNFVLKFKIKMNFRKSFEYIYSSNDV